MGGPSVATRRVIALGTSNRNIALALLIATVKVSRERRLLRRSS